MVLPEDSTLKDGLLINALFELLCKNRTFQKLNFVSHTLPDWIPAKELTAAFNQNPVIRELTFGDLKLEKKKLDHQRLDNAAANILNAGRPLLGAKKVCGLTLPRELIDCILQQYTVDNEWHQENWRMIRRAVMDRGTIGKLVSDQQFSAEELLYICNKL